MRLGCVIGKMKEVGSSYQLRPSSAEAIFIDQAKLLGTCKFATLCRRSIMVPGCCLQFLRRNLLDRSGELRDWKKICFAVLSFLSFSD